MPRRRYYLSRWQVIRCGVTMPRIIDGLQVSGGRGAWHLVYILISSDPRAPRLLLLVCMLGSGVRIRTMPPHTVRAAVLAPWRSHCEAGIGLIAPISYYQDRFFAFCSSVVTAASSVTLIHPYSHRPLRVTQPAS